MTLISIILQFHPLRHVTGLPKSHHSYVNMQQIFSKQLLCKERPIIGDEAVNHEIPTDQEYCICCSCIRLNYTCVTQIMYLKKSQICTCLTSIHSDKQSDSLVVLFLFLLLSFKKQNKNKKQVFWWTIFHWWYVPSYQTQDMLNFLKVLVVLESEGFQLLFKTKISLISKVWLNCMNCEEHLMCGRLYNICVPLYRLNSSNFISGLPICSEFLM